MGPEKPLPYDEDHFEDATAYVDSLLNLLCTKDLLRILCGGVHLLDLFTSDDDLYSRVLPQEWRDFFENHRMMDLLDLCMREDLAPFHNGDSSCVWRNGPPPPLSLVEYLEEVRVHLLNRDVGASQCSRNRKQKKLARHVAVGMNVKKVHEVGLYAAYVDELANSLQSDDRKITQLVDFGSGQNYLGRALASDPYKHDIVAIESKSHNSERAKDFDVKARVVEKQRVMRNKKAHRTGGEEPSFEAAPPRSAEAIAKWPEIERTDAIRYIDHRIADGDLSDVVAQIPSAGKVDKNLMIISLHSCGNLVHHGLRSLTLNSDVKAVALVGCCYNLLTERLGPATYKLPELRPTTHLHPRLRNGNSSSDEEEPRDPHGFPMSNRFVEADVRLNITARMMAVQAPQNWGERDSEAFFTRHFYRALLQRVFLDYGVVGPPTAECVGGSPAGHSSGGTPITIGSLRKGCYATFVTYVRGAMEKMCAPNAPNPVLRDLVTQKLCDVTDEELAAYERRYMHRKKDLSVTWSLMAFSAGVVEAAILVDRWLWLKEQEEVESAWVEGVFEHGLSPRNMVVVGVKRGWGKAEVRVNGT